MESPLDALIRPATLDDVPALTVLIQSSARTLAAGDYTPKQIEAALKSAWGVDTDLIRDGTYFVVEASGRIAACGGWSLRKTLFGGDAQLGREAQYLNPATDAARIRAFFVHPDFARKGLGRMLLSHCEAAARQAGFTRAALVATLPGVRLYEKFGYLGTQRTAYPLSDGITIEFVPMEREL